MAKMTDTEKLNLLIRDDPEISGKMYARMKMHINEATVADGRCEYCKDGKSFIGARMLLGNDGKWHDINNCPNCGAKMDGDEDG